MFTKAKKIAHLKMKLSSWNIPIKSLKSMRKKKKNQVCNINVTDPGRAPVFKEVSYARRGCIYLIKSTV